MRLTKTSMLSGTTATREIDLTEEELDAYHASGRPIQQMFPRLPPEDREFVMTGITPEEWHRFCPNPESDPDESS